MSTAQCRLYGPLNDLVEPRCRQRDLAWHWDTPEPVREMIEGLGVPQLEVGLIVVNGEASGWSRRLQHGDRVSVFPSWRSLGIHSPVPLTPWEQPSGRYLLDVHLGRLARWLRLLGIDTAYSSSFDDDTLAQLCQRERRILLTRDRQLLMRSAVAHGNWMRSQAPREQLAEILECYDLAPLLRPYTRCAHCNGVLVRVPKEQVAEEVPPSVARRVEFFARCPGCGHVYWPGSHQRRSEALFGLIVGYEAGSGRE